MANVLLTVPNFLMQVRDEIRRVIWPSRDTVIRLTTQVITISIIFAIIIGALDAGFTYLTELTLR